MIYFFQFVGKEAKSVMTKRFINNNMRRVLVIVTDDGLLPLHS